MSILNMMWFQQVLGNSTGVAPKLVEQFGVENLYEARNSQEFLSQLSPYHRKRLNNSCPTDYEQRLKYCTENDISILSIGSSKYPTQLFALENPPVLLYVKGDIKLLKEGYLVAVVGTRTPSVYGVDTTKAICEEMTRHDITLVSGLAAGLDSVAHRAAIAAGTPTIAVLGNGIDYFYPPSNRELQLAIAKNGVLVSEFPPTTEPFKGSFIMRNRIIAGLADVLLVTEARDRSGTMSTASFASDMGRTIFAVPGNITTPMSSGTNNLIYDGATPVTSTTSILFDCGFIVKEKKATAEKQDISFLSPAAAELYNTLPNEPILLEELYEIIGRPIQEILTALTELELSDLADRLLGGYVYKKTLGKE